jgi:hypothetical protein
VTELDFPWVSSFEPSENVSTAFRLVKSTVLPVEE